MTPEIAAEDVLPMIDHDATSSNGRDWYDYDEGPRKGLTNAKTPEQKIDGLRSKIFAEGSAFKHTEREEIVGIDNVLTEIDQVCHWLSHSKVYRKHGSRLEPGVIFEGEPGTGKTLVSRYIASQSDALFVNVRDFAISGTLFKGADIADLFRRARETYAVTKRPIVLFWDEFENAAIERANASPEQGATVSQLTAELDGVHGKNEGIILIGCTNYIYGIDAALRRSGRMGLQIEFSPPDREGKKLLLNHYLAHYTLKGEIDVDTLAYFFDSDATAADIEESCMEAWRFAVRRMIDQGKRKPTLAQADLIDVFLKRLVGPPTAFVNLPLDERARIAVHEVGHAVMALVYDIPLRLITVQPGKKALGRTITAEMQEHIGTVDEMMSQMRVGIGSNVAERECKLPALVGSGGDIRSVNQIAAKLVENLYAGDRTSLFSLRAVASARTGRTDGASPNVSAEAVEEADFDVRGLLDTTFRDAMRVMSDIGHNSLWKIAKTVNDRVTLTGSEFKELFVEVTGQDPTEFRA